ncbi:YgiQ family radical SAM protein [Maridesulfovibrio ferrireducens]|uniref:YgiQ family radical SAM protein n=1 Tax=Maridesulfovibrio ferrireducens TaxID=246191 RepID=UPI001A222D67|nr:YgiQ family radical SAM protein [Maridesulfovibrio ferrireducens]MBI9110347.1 YgiQ family radical SAM protein [Maridesulfovibrio ferrireducens]
MTKTLIASKIKQPTFLPMTREEMDWLGWDRPDILLVSGDSYIDHPSFGIPLLGRVLTAHGYKVALVCQPDWKDTKDIEALGRPRLYAGVSAGALDSMLSHYTSFRKKRSDDAYTPGGKAGARPNRACIIYTNLIKKAFKGLPVVMGGIEASLRRISHFDFWTEKIRKTILMDSKADLLIYGMGERAMLEAADRLSEADEPSGATLRGINGTAFMGKIEDIPADAEVIELPSHQDILDDPQMLMKATLLLEEQVHYGKAWAIQKTDSRYVVITPPAIYLNTNELDWLYTLPFARLPHPSYDDKGRIPAAEMIEFSITSHRGCGGGCSFCSIAMHQGRHIRSRSKKSILNEAAGMNSHSHFRGSISDIGGPSANMWNAKCSVEREKCKRKSCLVPNICPNFKYDQKANLDLLKQTRNLDGIKHVRVASGVRFDLGLKDRTSLREIFKEFVGGQLKVAPEHISPEVLKHMRKPDLPVFESFLELFEVETKNAGKNQYVIPYLMSAFPGCTDADMRMLADWLKAKGWSPKQVQCFIPTPGTVATAMYYTGTTPDGERIFVAKTDAQRLKQHGILIPDATRDPRSIRYKDKQTKPEKNTKKDTSKDFKGNKKFKGKSKTEPFSKKNKKR